MISTIDYRQLLGISIVSRDRLEDLTATLRQLKRAGLDKYETVVIDDGSRNPVPSFFHEEFYWIRFERSESSRGATAQRNRAAWLMRAPYMLSLDDDSFPITGDLEGAVAWLVEHPKVTALAFPIVYRDNSPRPQDLEGAPFPVRFFINCAALVRRELFLELGGFDERIEINGEEPNYCLKAFVRGHATYAYPTVVVRHQVVPQARPHARRNRLLIRNEMLNALWFYPHPDSYWRALRCLPSFLIRNASMRATFPALLAGWFEAPIRYLTWPQSGRRLTRAQFEEWKALPGPSDPRY